MRIRILGEELTVRELLRTIGEALLIVPLAWAFFVAALA